MKNIEDIYKNIGSQLNDSIDSSWDKIELNIECSDKYIGTNAKYQINGEWKNALNLVQKSYILHNGTKLFTPLKRTVTLI